MAEKITIREADGTERTLELDLDEITIGRADDNIIQITEKRSSRKHLRFEETPDGYVVHDLDTPNGTRVNGLRIDGSIALKVGDTIQIGECTIQIGDAPAAPVVAEKPEKKKAEKKAEKKKGETQKIKKKKDKKRRPAAISSVTAPMTSQEKAQVRKMKAMAPLVVIPLVLAVAGMIGWNLYESSTKSGELSRGLAKVESAAGSAYSVQDMQSAVDEIDAWMRKVAEYDMHDRFGKKVVALTKKSKALSQRVAVLRNADREFENLQTRRKAGMDDQEYYSRLLGLAKVFADTPVVEDINTALDDVRMALQDRLRKRVDGVAGVVDQLVAQRLYRKALDSIDDFERVLTEGELADDEMAKGIVYKLTPMRKKALVAMQTDLATLESQFEATVSRREFDEARDLLAAALDRFKGTPYVYQIRRDIAAIKILRKMPVRSAGTSGSGSGATASETGKVDLAEARKAAEEAARYIKVLEEAKALCRKGQYQKALAKLRTVASKGGALGAEFSQYVKDVEGFLALKDDFVKQTNAKKLHDSSWTMGSRKWVIEGATDERITLRMDGGAGTTAASFRQLGYRGLYTLFGKMTLEPQQWQTVGVYCWYHDMEVETHHSLIQGIKAKSAQRGEIYSLYSRLSGIPQPQEGFIVFMRRIMTPRQKQMAMAEAQADKLLARLGGGGKKSDQAFKDFQQLLTDSAEKFGDSFAKNLKKNVVTKLQKKRKQALASLKGGGGLGTVDQLDKLQDELDKRRAHALKLIFDVKAYPYDACHGCKAQPEVDKRVDAVKVIWNDPFSSGVIPGSVSGTVDKIKQINDQLAKLDAPPVKEDGIDLDHVKAIANKKLDIKTYGGNGQKSLIAYNEQVMKDNEEKDTKATNAEKKQVEITNEYRIMMGRRALKLDDNLTMAARGHSQYMQSTGKWGHVIAGHPDGDTPQQRAAKHGYSAGTGENIFKGSSSPHDAFRAWYNSSGHHRNMLNPNWKSMGAGHDGKHWTQLFGGK